MPLRVVAAYKPTSGPIGRMSLDSDVKMPYFFIGVATGLFSSNRFASRLSR